MCVLFCTFEVQAGELKNVSYSVDGVERTAGLYIPDNYDKSQKWPLVIFLHGGGNGGDNKGNATSWASRQPIIKEIMNAPEKFPALVLIPRCPKDKIWAPVGPEVLMSKWRKNKFGDVQKADAANHITKAIDTVISQYSVNEKKISLTGFSMGGEGSIRYGALNAKRFAAIAPLAGSAIAIRADVKALASTNIWMFQGEKDGLSTAELARKMSAWLKEAGGNIKYTEFEGVGHGIPGKAYSYPGMLKWLISQERK